MNIILGHRREKHPMKKLFADNLVFGHRVGLLCRMVLGLAILQVAGPSLFYLSAQPKYSNLEIIPTTNDSATGTLKWLEKRANGTHSFSWSAPDSLAASVPMKWPTDGVTGYLFSDGAGNTSWQAAGTGC